MSDSKNTVEAGDTMDIQLHGNARVDATLSATGYAWVDMFRGPLVGMTRKDITIYGAAATGVNVKLYVPNGCMYITITEDGKVIKKTVRNKKVKEEVD